MKKEEREKKYEKKWKVTAKMVSKRSEHMKRLRRDAWAVIIFS
jgi:hypothetical protein